MDVLKHTRDAYEELALHRIKTGQQIPSYSVKTDLGNRAWKENVNPDLVQMLTGVDVSRKELKTPKQAELAGLSKEIVDSFCERREKGVKLVRMDSSAKAEQMFGKKS